MPLLKRTSPIHPDKIILSLSALTRLHSVELFDRLVSSVQRMDKNKNSAIGLLESADSCFCFS